MSRCEYVCELCDGDATSGPGWRAVVGGHTNLNGMAVQRRVHEMRTSFWVRKGRRSTRRLVAEWWQSRDLPDVPADYPEA